MATQRVGNVARQAAPVAIHVSEFKYFMDEQLSGHLYLLHDIDADRKECMWRSAKTNLSSAWHGRWIAKSEPERGFYAVFDCKGKENGRGKFCDVSLTEQGFDSAGMRDSGMPMLHGTDHAGRSLCLHQKRNWIFDVSTGSYLDQPC